MDIYERFVSDFAERVQKLKMGDPSDPETKMGALISEDHMKKVLSYIELAKAEGGEVIAGGKQAHLPAPNDGGYFIEPTVIIGLDQNCRTNQEEIFGPVVTIMPFQTEEEAVALANQTPYGLAAVVWSDRLDRAHRVAGQLHTGLVWVNCWLLRDLRTPFGGVKQSGMGREGGWEAIRFFTEPKNVTIKYEH
jgi:aminomuconate-semialdehyde/2-hydroxymuconate-6-semialdehyde dehydrogenase